MVGHSEWIGHVKGRLSARRAARMRLPKKSNS